MLRRRFLGFGLMLVGFGRRAWAAQLGSAPPSYIPLTAAIRVPLGSVAALWQPSPFVAEAVLPQSSPTPGRRVVLKGVLFRKEAGDATSALTALSVTCPHEQCPVELIIDSERLAKLRGGASGPPMFECGCHFSKFDASQEGAWISGVAYRGLFRFRIGAVSDGNVEINGIEEEALSVL
jgi:Rieske Fe-S protein